MIAIILIILCAFCSFTDSKCVNSSQIVQPEFCQNIVGNRSIYISDGPEFFISGLTGFNIDQATHQSLFLPPECRKALIPFICGSGYQECHTVESKELQSIVTIPKPLCKSVCKNVEEHCAEVFEANGQPLPDCSNLNNNSTSVVIALTNEKINIPCFTVDTDEPAPDFIYDCPWPFITTTDGCVFRCPAPLTDDRDEEESFENGLLWTRRLFYFPVYICGVIFFVTQLICYTYWFEHSRILVLVLKGFLVFTNVWNLIGMRSNSDPVCRSRIEQAEIDDPACVAQAFFISSFAGIGWIFFWIATKYLYEFYYSLYKRKFRPWMVYTIIVIGILLELIPPIVILSTKSYVVLALTCSVDYYASVGEFDHFYFWLLNGPETVTVYLGLIVVFLLVAFTIKSTVAVLHLNNQQKLRRLMKRGPFITFIILFGGVIAVAQYTTLKTVETDKIAKGAEEWAICLITNMVNGLFFATRNIDQPECFWENKLPLWEATYGIMSPALFDIVLMALFAKSLIAGLKLRINKTLSSRWNSQTSTSSSDQSKQTKSQSNSNSNNSSNPSSRNE